MINIFETVTKRLLEAWKSDEPSGRRSAFSCRCGRPVFFYNSLCLGCKSPLGFEPELEQVRALLPGKLPDTWMLDGQEDAKAAWKRCQNLESPAGWNLAR